MDQQDSTQQEPVRQTTHIRFSLRTFLLTHILIGAIATVVCLFGFSPDVRKTVVFPYAVVGTMFVYWLVIIRLPWSYERVTDPHAQPAQPALEQPDPTKTAALEINPSSTEALR